MSTTRAQHMDALEEANRIRLGAAEFKRRIRSGDLAVAAILDPANEVPDVLRSMPIAKLLTAQRQWGPDRARKYLRALQISETRRVGDLTARQRRALVEMLGLMPSERRELLAA